MKMLEWIASRILRVIFLILPCLTSHIAKIARGIFSIRVNDEVTLKAGLGLHQLQHHPVCTKALTINIHLPIAVDLSLADYTQSSTFFSGLPPLCVTLMEHASPRTLFFDIGANIGLVSAAMGQVVPHRAIHAFEANPSTFQSLLQNLKANCPEASAHCVALSDKEGFLTMSLIANDSGSSSVERDRFAGQRKWHDQSIQVKQLEVPAVTLSHWVEQNLRDEWSAADQILMKIDVEGHELQVLQGMQSLWTKSQQAALCVIESENRNSALVRSMFESWGFELHRPCWNAKLAEFPHHTDLVFRRR